MTRAHKYSIMVVMAIMIMSLSACNNLGLLDQIENPGSTTGDKGKTATIYLFATTTPTNANLTGGTGSARTGADNSCLASRGALAFADNTCNRVRAVISLSSADSIGNLPANYGIPTNSSINSPNGFVIANDWFTLVSGTSGNNLGGSGVMTAATAWWSFSTLGGNYDNTNNCIGGTDGTTGNGAIADSSTSGNTWLASGTNTCPGSARLLCICY